MIISNLASDFNICSGKNIFLPKIINFINKKLKNKSVYFDNQNLGNIVGSNKKLLNKGWKMKRFNFLNEIKNNL